MKRTSSNLFVLSVAVLSILATSNACRKKKDTIAKVYVYDASESPVASANVILSGNATPPVKGKIIDPKEATTNSKGEAIFNFNDLYQLGQAGVAVLDITASKGELGGKGIIKIEAEVTTEESVIIQ